MIKHNRGMKYEKKIKKNVSWVPYQAPHSAAVLYVPAGTRRRYERRKNAGRDQKKIKAYLDCCCDIWKSW